MPSKPMSQHDKEEKDVEMTELVAGGGQGSDDNGNDNDDHGPDKEHAALLSSFNNTIELSPSSPSPSPGHPSGVFTSDDNIQERIATLQYARKLLYLSHLFAQFSEVSWQFSLTIFLAALNNFESLFLVATYGLTTGTAVTLLGSTIGSLVDRTNRLTFARGFICTENICVVLATLCCFQLLSQTTTSSPDSNRHHHQDDGRTSTSPNTPTGTSSLLLIIVIHILGASARVLDAGFLVAMERDWVVVMSRYVMKDSKDDDSSKEEEEAADDAAQHFNSRAWLSETNVAMKQIDLSCKVAAPAMSGFLIAIVNHRVPTTDTEVGSDTSQEVNISGSQFRYAALAVGAINALSLVVEYYCTTIIYQSIPDLAFLTKKEDHRCVDDEQTNASPALPITNATTVNRCTAILPYGARVYLQQKTAFAGIGLAMLYLNALTFDAIFTAYLVWRGMGLETIGIWRGVSSAIGLLGTCVYHWSARRMTLEMTGLWSIIYEFLCLSLSYGSLFVDDDHASLIMLIAGVCASRIGLWVFDITVTQMMQEYIPDGVRGVVGGVQQSLNAFFNLFSYAIGIVVPDPSHFYIYVAAGYASVGVAMVLYGVGLYSKNSGTGPIQR